MYHQKYYKVIGIDLSRQTNTSIPQQISFVGKVEEDHGATMFFVSEKQQKTIPNFSLDSLIVTEQESKRTSKSIKFIEWNKWFQNPDIVIDQSNANYGVGNEVIYNIEVLKSNLCDYFHAYIFVRGDITIIGHRVTQVAFKNCGPFTKCITKVDGAKIDDTKDFDLDLVMPMYSLIEYTAPTVPLKFLSNFWRSLKMTLINWKVELTFKSTKCSVLSAAGTDNANANSNNIMLTIKDMKFYVPVVNLSAKYNKKLSNLLSKGFERPVYWNEYETKSENKDTTNEYRYFLESNFVRVSKLFVLVYKNQDGNAKRFNARKHYLPKGMIKNYNVIINENNFYDQAIDADIKRCDEIRKITTGQDNKWRLHYWMFMRLLLYQKSL